MNSREVEKGNATNSCLTRQIYTFLIDINNFEVDLSHSKSCTNRTYCDFVAVDHTPQNWLAPYISWQVHNSQVRIDSTWYMFNKLEWYT